MYGDAWGEEENTIIFMTAQEWPRLKSVVNKFFILFKSVQSRLASDSNQIAIGQWFVSNRDWAVIQIKSRLGSDSNQIAIGTVVKSNRDLGFK